MKRIWFTLFLVLALTMSMASVASAENSTPQNGTTLSATKTATGHWTRTFHWTIDKSVDPATWDMFTGDSGTSTYTISVTKDNGTDLFFVDGEICVTNGGSVTTENLTIVDQIEYKVGSGKFGNLAGASQIITPAQLGPGASACYAYSIAFTPVAGATYRNVAHITITNHSGWFPGGTNCPSTEPCPFGPDPKADFSLPSSPTLINDSVNVDDTNGDSWSFGDDDTVSYDKTFTCNNDEGQYDNTATIRETGQSDDASVIVNCYAIEVTKDANTSFKRTYNWDINKSADQTGLLLSAGQSFAVNYDVTVSNTGYTDSDWAVSGGISVYNPAPIGATINGVSDVISGVGAADVDCGVDFPYTLAAGDTLECTYSADLPNGTNRTNTATATLQNTPSGTTDFSGSANVDFGDADVTEADRCIDVTDTLYGDLGTVCLGSAPHTFTYTYNVGPYLECGKYTVDNTASFSAPSGANGSATRTVDVTVPCAGGCTLTQGYWKTHSSYGPAPYDDTWALLSSGANTPFFLSGKSWYQVFWTAPAGNAYYNLAHQYMAAKLNILNGADSSSVNFALSQAEALFKAYAPADVALMKGKAGNATRSQFINLASILDQYNNGLIGPGHCSE